MTDRAGFLPQESLEALERAAAELAALAGAEISGALGATLAVRYKGGGPEGDIFRDPVSEVDHRTEMLIRERLARDFPGHGILGEELDDVPADEKGLVWAVDPIDGTTNFVNGFPLFAASVGVLHHGRPVAGAVWCATSHALRPGVYHAREGGRLRFESEVLELHPNPAVRRRLAGSPGLDPKPAPHWDHRKTGSAAVECAFVAAGLMQVAWFATPNVWDVAGGIVLAQASGRTVHSGGGAGWAPFQGFDPADLHGWRGPLALGEPEAVAALLAEA
ncbi:inositol monophosphatase family protein [Lutibaculum baratangense]|uniref:Inositol-phosphate phosphatase n=1 Tax=Lutibaculum baratangense AMV1 TaxID=631454 RepID=V4QT22_9HYPH|nr:inositol monophosphatase [Lutibaculum baratangense]ESR22877.1 Inositol-phosphate phosphatase [Lutibaculum baratangense AMV1]